MWHLGSVETQNIETVQNCVLSLFTHSELLSYIYCCIVTLELVPLLLSLSHKYIVLWLSFFLSSVSAISNFYEQHPFRCRHSASHRLQNAQFTSSPYQTTRTNVLYVCWMLKVKMLFDFGCVPAFSFKGPICLVFCICFPQIGIFPIDCHSIQNLSNTRLLCKYIYNSINTRQIHKMRH